MIKYKLICDFSHEFEGWFQTSAAFDAQNQVNIITCPVCDSANVRRALMTPNLASPKRRRVPPAANVQNTDTLTPLPLQQDKPLGSRAAAPNASSSATEIGEALAQLRQLQRKIKTECRDVGTEFAEEARKIHHGESAPENIYGQSSDEERRELADEGIDVLAVPWLPPEH